MKPKNLTKFDLLTLNSYHERELRRRQPGVSDTGLWRYVLAWLPALNKNAIKSFKQHILQGWPANYAVFTRSICKFNNIVLSLSSDDVLARCSLSCMYGPVSARPSLCHKSVFYQIS